VRLLLALANYLSTYGKINSLKPDCDQSKLPARGADVGGIDTKARSALELGRDSNSVSSLGSGKGAVLTTRRGTGVKRRVDEIFARICVTAGKSYRAGIDAPMCEMSAAIG
jgi:hypothetical protein